MGTWISYGTAIGRKAASLALVTLVVGCAHSISGPSVLRSVFPSAQDITEIPLDESAGPARKLYVAHGPSEPIAYAVEEEMVSRSGPFTILVIIDSQFSVERVQVLSYPGERGGEVRSATFLRQFEGKGRGDPIRLGVDVDAVTGATISSRAVAKGVRQAIRLLGAEFGIGP